MLAASRRHPLGPYDAQASEIRLPGAETADHAIGKDAMNHFTATDKTQL